MATFNRYATNQRAAPQRPGDDEDFRQLAAAHLAMPQQLQPPPGQPTPAPSGNNAPPPGASSTPMTTAQMNDGGVDSEMHSIAARALGGRGGSDFGGLNTSGAIGMGRGPQQPATHPGLTGADAVGANVNVGTAPTYNAANGGVSPSVMHGSMGQQVGSVDGKPIMSGNTPASVTALQGTTGPNGTRAANGMGGGFAAQQPKAPSAQAAAPSGAQSTQTTQQQQDQAQYDATQRQLEADKQKSLLDARARAGLGGFGLSGAASAQQGDITRTMDRTATQTLADLRTSQQANARANDNQKFTDEQRQAALDLLEEEGDFDANGDGMVGGHKVGGVWGDGNPDNNDAASPGQAGAAAQDQAAAAVQKNLAGHSTGQRGLDALAHQAVDAVTGSTNDQAGSEHNPYTYTQKDLDHFAQANGLKLTKRAYNGIVEYVDQYGNTFEVVDANGNPVKA